MSDTTENPTEYRGFPIRYVVNDVAPETMTAVVKDGSVTITTTSERIFASKEAWHDDIKSKVDQYLNDPKCVPQSDPRALLEALSREPNP